MRRRALLSALTVGAVPLGGCLSRVPADDPRPNGSPTPEPSQSPTVSPSHDSPPCPDLGDDAETVCVGDRPADPRSALFDATVPDETLPTAEATFTLSNTTDAELASNFYSWRLFKYAKTAGGADAEKGWVHVTPRPVPEPLMMLEPGAPHTWRLAVDNTTLGTTDEAVDAGGTSDLRISGLGPGHYVFTIGVNFPERATLTASRDSETGTRTSSATPSEVTRSTGDASTTAPSTTASSTTAPSTSAPSTTAPSTTAPSTTAPSSPTRSNTSIDRPQYVQYVARFRLTGPAPALLPTPDAKILDQQGGLLEVITDVGREHDHPETVVVERAPEHAAEAEPLPLELAYRIHGVRNTVPFFEPGVDRVELTTGNYVWLLPFDEGGGYATVQGSTYRFDRASA